MTNRNCILALLLISALAACDQQEERLSRAQTLADAVSEQVSGAIGDDTAEVDPFPEATDTPEDSPQ